MYLEISPVRPASTRSTAPLCTDQTLSPRGAEPSTLFSTAVHARPHVTLPTPDTTHRHPTTVVFPCDCHRHPSTECLPMSHVISGIPPSNSQHVPPSHPRLRGRQLRVNTSGGLAAGCTLTRTRRCRREASRSVPGTAPQGCCAVSHTHSRDGDTRRVEHMPRGSRAGARWTRHSSWHTARSPSQKTHPESRSSRWHSRCERSGCCERSGRWHSPSCRTARRMH